MTRAFMLTTFVALAVFSAPADASAQSFPAPWGQSRATDQRSYDDGYRSGLRAGERDGRSGRRPDYRHHDDYRRGSSGWNWKGGGWANRSSEAIFRRGFVEGYAAGYDRYRGRYGRQGYPDDRYGQPGGGYGYPDGRYGAPGYPQGGYGYPGGGYGSRYGSSPAGQRGFQDGYREGRDDAHDNDRYEPTRKRAYREGDDGYQNRYGSRDQYKAEYRRAFQQGYDRGYREGRYR